MKKVLACLGVLAIWLLGFQAMTMGVFKPSPGWAVFSVLPAAFAAWYLAKVAARQSRAASRRPASRNADRAPIFLCVLMFIGPYLFANWFVGMNLALVTGEMHQRRAIVHRWDPNARASRRGGRCVRVGAMIEHPRKIPVNLCLHTRYGFVLGSGSLVYLQTYESIIGDVIVPKIYFAPIFDGDPDR
ncbi:hypothetical protein QLQ15_09240 [Lysobacter sp. LF1]|uniref:Uncharacterized protein n=1 Tax=Lysobacter stagni TaxID=3045172 RepID=A0ABT6XG14_9GAMM|nr:hypothetical protein [Lysobacter sp. LF1]MDI9239092.1 hypothetical protein [Lysobacter sp. LF1]